MNIIYCLCHKYYTYSEKLNKLGIKIGSTCNIISRCKTYRTGYPDRVPLICYYKVSKNCYIIDNNLKKHFDDIRFKNKGGGIEFYDANKLTLDVLEYYFVTNNIQFTKYTPDDLFFENISKSITNDDKNNFNNDEINKELDERNIIQKEYVDDAINNLEQYGKVLIKAPTGFGKTHIMYKIVSQLKPNSILILTPRILLNKQIVEDKYICNYINGYKIYHNSDTKFIFTGEINIIVTACYQSYDNFINTQFDLVIYDEAHTISEKEIFIESKYKLFLTATPTEDMTTKENIFGKIIEKVKVYELINMNILCDFKTICKKLEVKKDYADLGLLICNSMKEYNKSKGIIYLNTCDNAIYLYKHMKKQNDIKIYIYISEKVDVIDNKDYDIKEFEKDTNKAVIISVKKIGYGYDNANIDFICLGDPRNSDIDIRQVIGRGLRYKPNKILHILLPIYPDEIGKQHIKKYLDYIISECGKDIIIKNSSNNNDIKENNKSNNTINYEGDEIPTKIINDYCTTGYNMFSKFMNFLKVNNVYDEQTYNKLKETMDWMPIFGNLRDKYPKFCFRYVHPNNLNYYWHKEECYQARDKCIEIVKEKYNFEIFRKLVNSNKYKLINEIDFKIPLQDLEYYYL